MSWPKITWFHPDLFFWIHMPVQWAGLGRRFLWKSGLGQYRDHYILRFGTTPNPRTRLAALMPACGRFVTKPFTHRSLWREYVAALRDSFRILLFHQPVLLRVGRLLIDIRRSKSKPIAAMTAHLSNRKSWGRSSISDQSPNQACPIPTGKLLSRPFGGPIRRSGGVD